MNYAPIPAGSADVAILFMELGVLVVVLALLARVATRYGFSPVPLYLLGGLLFEASGLAPMSDTTAVFVSSGAEIGVILLLFMIGLEYSGDELAGSLRSGLPSGIVDFLLNFTPGLLLGLFLDWGVVAALLLGGVTYISSSGVIAKLLNDLGWLGNRETPAVLIVLVMEDLAMAIFLPLMVVLLLGSDLLTGAISLTAALATVAVVLVLAIRYGGLLSRFMTSGSDEVVLLTTLGVILLVSGLAQQLQVSAAVGAFLVGIALSGPVAEKAHELLSPLRDLFAATFFIFFGLQTNSGDLVSALPLALLLGAVTALTKIGTGWYAAGRLGVAPPGRIRAGLGLVARGEFSIVIAGLGTAAGLTPELGALAAAYVLLMAVSGSILTRLAAPIVRLAQQIDEFWQRRRANVAEKENDEPDDPTSVPVQAAE